MYVISKVFSDQREKVFSIHVVFSRLMILINTGFIICD